MKITSMNPATETINKSFNLYSKSYCIKVSSEAKNAFLKWKVLPLQKRTAHLLSLARVLRANKKEYARLITIEMGKPITQSLDEIEKCAWAAETYASNSKRWLKDEIVKTESKKSLVAVDPLGPLLCIMPWNFPFWQALRCAIPALAVGNTVILRHSNKVPMCALAIEEAIKKAGFPDCTFKTILSDYETVSALIANENVKGVSVTGSIETGTQIAIMAGKALKKCVLELGGSDPFIVLEDADMGKTVEGAVRGRLLNSGQSCISAKRFIIAKNRYEEFTNELTKRFNEIKPGDPLDKDTMVGPLASKEQLDKIESQVSDAIRKGATITAGGKRSPRKGYFYEPTIISDSKPTMRVLSEEVFGPVAALIPVNDLRTAIKIANMTSFGLGASVWTRDTKKGEKIARMIDAGSVFVNKNVRSDPRLPFGGIKKSGIGRELSHYGLLEFTNIKTIAINS